MSELLLGTQFSVLQNRYPSLKDSTGLRILNGVPGVREEFVVEIQYTGGTVKTFKANTHEEIVDHLRSMSEPKHD